MGHGTPDIWYKNWLTCEICNIWVTTLKDLMIFDHHIKAFKAFLWMVCVTQFSQGYCKYMIGETVDLIKADFFVLMMSGDFQCSYLFDLCEPHKYTQLLTKDWTTSKLADKPNDIISNDYVDKLYSLSNPSLNPPTFRILWMSDVNIDINYKENSSSVCKDYQCCHAGDKVENEADKAGKYGNKKCSTSLAGFQKMIETIN